MCVCGASGRFGKVVLRACTVGKLFCTGWLDVSIRCCDKHAPFFFISSSRVEAARTLAAAVALWGSVRSARRGS